MRLTLAEADAIADATLRAGAEQGLKPLGVVVLDAGGHAVVTKRGDDASILRLGIASAKAYTALAFGPRSRVFAETTAERPAFAASLGPVSERPLLPAPGGVSILRDGVVIGAVGVSGDVSDADEAVAIAGIEAAGLTAAG